MVENVKKNLSESCKRLTEYIDSGFSDDYQGFDINKIFNDWTQIRSVLAPGVAGPDIRSVVESKTNMDNNFTEALKWISDYIDSGCDEKHLESCKKMTLTRCALITKFLNSADEFPSPLFILWAQLRSIFSPCAVKSYL